MVRSEFAMAGKHDKGTSQADVPWPQPRTRSNVRDDVRGSSTAVDRLLAQVALGDFGAFTAVYDQVAGTVHSLVLQLVGDPDQSLNVAGDVLTEVWRTASEFRPSAGSGMSWIMAIARRRAVGHVRALRAAANGNGRLSLARVVEDVTEQAGASAGLLTGMPEPQRQALLLVCYGGYTQGQVADLLVVPPGTVSAWIRDGLPRLHASPE
jgi:RNA polymerase sigma-70 factor, ECF subfamily